MNESEIINFINRMTHVDMARAWRFCRVNSFFDAAVLFDYNAPYYAVFRKRFDDFGGFTPEISKLIGWGK